MSIVPGVLAASVAASVTGAAVAASMALVAALVWLFLGLGVRPTTLSALSLETCSDGARWRDRAWRPLERLVGLREDLNARDHQAILVGKPRQRTVPLTVIARAPRLATRL